MEIEISDEEDLTTLLDADGVREAGRLNPAGGNRRPWISPRLTLHAGPS